MHKLIAAASAAALAVSSSAAAAEDEDKGSLYLQCDGQPNNMTEGESFARLLGAVTLLGIFAKSPEAPDPSKRQFGEAGVSACTQLIDGAEIENNGIRRLPLILARALHQIEAKNYQAAIDDVGKARAEAAALGLVGNPYFDRSMGLSFGSIEAEARLRLGDAPGAQHTSLSRMQGMDHSAFAILVANGYYPFVRELTPESERALTAQARILPAQFSGLAAQLEEAGRFEEAAGKRETVIATVEELEAIAESDDADVPSLHGWRRKLFGEKAIALKNGELGLVLERGRVKIRALAQG